ncbi:shikimate dehydrogenase [uncultured Alsobacter sp.]|uniref:shikimate dehydrogenase family protein n=1 Tax=uncultured Alsobacter sp. TaxID=1748258 RepID=UPI0025D7F8CC|nr:ThiF family adenylyltransferase [uncultured Alsobacter sp.]
MIDGNTLLIAHVGYPTTTFKSPGIYNPWFASVGCNAVVVPMAVQQDDFEPVLAALKRLRNIRGALITMPHKRAAVDLVDHVSVAAQIAGACNAIRFEADGTTTGEQFDGEGFVRGVTSKNRTIRGAHALVVGAGGVGSAIAASLAAAGVGSIALYDPDQSAMDVLAARLTRHYPTLAVVVGDRDPAGRDIVVNASPLGMNDGDPLPLDVTRIAASSFVGEVVLKAQITPFLAAARARGCQYQVGTDMLFEQIPAYLEFFGLPVASPDTLRKLATLG